MATGLGSSCWPRQGTVLGRAACRVGGRKVQQRSPATAGRRGGFISVPFFCGSCQSCCRMSSPCKHSLLFTEWQAHSRAGAGWHLWRWPCPAPCTEQGQPQQPAWGCVQLCFEFSQAQTSRASPSRLLLTCKLYLQNLSPFVSQKGQKASFGGFCRQCLLSAPM